MEASYVRTHAVKHVEIKSSAGSGWHIHVSLEVFSPDSDRLYYIFSPHKQNVHSFSACFLVFIRK